MSVSPRSRILIVTEECDGHADVVILRLRELGYQPVRIHPHDFPCSADFGWNLDERGLGGSLRTHKTEVRFDEVRSVWWRRPAAYVLPEGLSKEEKRFARQEIEHAMTGLWSALDCFWMSVPRNIRAASSKLDQLKRAAALGFEVPRTLVTNRPDEVVRFFERCQRRMIYKVLSSPLLDFDQHGNFAMVERDGRPVGRATMTTLLTEEKLMLHLDSIRNTPCQFQEYIEKKSELRVTIIGDRIFVAEIDSQARPQTKVDWRYYEIPMIIRPGFLPAEVIDRCFELVRGYGLAFSAIDLIVTPDDRYVFLENNPNGQWAFVQSCVPEFKMVEALADCLIHGRQEGAAVLAETAAV